MEASLKTRMSLKASLHLLVHESSCGETTSPGACSKLTAWTESLVLLRVPSLGAALRLSVTTAPALRSLVAEAVGTFSSLLLEQTLEPFLHACVSRFEFVERHVAVFVLIQA